MVRTIDVMRAAALVAIFVAGACSGGPSAASATALPASPVAATPAAASSTPVTSPPRAAASLMAMRLTDVRTGQAFTLADFLGRAVIVEGMAVW